MLPLGWSALGYCSCAGINFLVMGAVTGESWSGSPGSGWGAAMCCRARAGWREITKQAESGLGVEGTGLGLEGTVSQGIGKPQQPCWPYIEMEPSRKLVLPMRALMRTG